MNLDFLSGLALTTVALATLAYLIWEVLGDRIGHLKNAHRYLADAYAKYMSSEAKPVNDHLIGSIGKVVAHSGDSTRPMNVRLNLEFWPACLSSTEDGLLAVGSAVRVTRVDGPILVVEASDDVAE